MWLHHHLLRGVDSVHLQILYNGHVLTMWFMVCRRPQSQEGDWVRPRLCKLARHEPWPVWKRFISAVEWCCLCAGGTPVLTSFCLQRLLVLAVAGTSVFILSFGPFIVNVSLCQLLTLQCMCSECVSSNVVVHSCHQLHNSYRQSYR